MKKVKKGQVVLGLLLGICTLICLLPVLLVAVASFSSDTSIKEKGFSFFPTELSLDGYQYVFSFGNQIWTSYGVTILLTVTGTLFSLAIMSMFSYSVSRRNFQMRGFLSMLTLFPMLFSGGQLATYLVNTQIYHLRDTLLVLILPGVSTMYIMILRTYIQTSIPESIVESAKMDGAGEFRTFLQIVLPIMKPAIASVGFMQAVYYWNDWQKAFIYISSASKTPLQLLLIRIEKNIDFLMNSLVALPPEVQAMRLTLPQESGRMAILVIATGPIMIAYPFFQKYFVRGMTMGSVKG